MSALPPTAAQTRTCREVRVGPIPDLCNSECRIPPKRSAWTGCEDRTEDGGMRLSYFDLSADFLDLAFASGLVTACAASMKRLAAGLSVRFFNVTTATGRGGAGKWTGNAVMWARMAP